jgi:membrane-associated phospholipid phosphatase
VVVGFAAGTAFVLVARAVARRETAPVDHEVHDETAMPRRHPARVAAKVLAPIGKWWAYVPIAALIAGYVVAAHVRRRDGRFGAAAAVVLVTTASAAAVLNHFFPDFLPQPPAPPGRPSRDHPVFPSGHTFGTMTVALIGAYVVFREKLAHGSIVFPAALTIPAASSLGRLAEEKHWISDIAGGSLAAIALASFGAAVYELTLRHNPGR